MTAGILVLVLSQGVAGATGSSLLDRFELPGMAAFRGSGPIVARPSVSTAGATGTAFGLGPECTIQVREAQRDIDPGSVSKRDATADAGMVRPSRCREIRRRVLVPE